jgi:hypothetical protein
MNKLFNGRKHKPEVTQNCPWDFPKFNPSPNLGARPLSSFPGVEHGNSKDANDKALDMQYKGRAQHPPFTVKIIHWATRSKDGSIPKMENGSQRKAEP